MYMVYNQEFHKKIEFKMDVIPHIPICFASLYTQCNVISGKFLWKKNQKENLFIV